MTILNGPQALRPLGRLPEKGVLTKRDKRWLSQRGYARASRGDKAKIKTEIGA